MITPRTLSRRALIGGSIALAAAAPSRAFAIPPVELEPDYDLADIAFARGSDVWMIDTYGENERVLLELDGLVRDLAWSPSGRYLYVRYYQSQMTAVVYDTETDTHIEVGGEAGWAADADELLVHRTRGDGYEGFHHLAADGTLIKAIAADMPMYGQCTYDFSPTDIQFLTWLQGGAMPSSGMYPTVLWSASDQVAYLGTYCGDTVEVDLSTGKGTQRPDQVIGLTPDYIMRREEEILIEYRDGGEPRMFAPGRSGLIVASLLPSGAAGGYRVFRPTASQATPETDPARRTFGLEILALTTADSDTHEIAQLDYISGSLPQPGVHGHNMYLGTLVRPNELLEYEFNNVPFDELEEQYQDYFRLVHVDMRTGEHRELATNARVPALRPKATS